ncbi:hypothetical protein E2C01_064184 [Portunus trituberculatus]|uniref:Uncharacterized protein n=1 Tax=Portunus trituberculatus TaxID=210409 RepID=A0A5B7HB16_PORTR|nr:hypothetical protein [Portunus trituberculatus]
MSSPVLVFLSLSSSSSLYLCFPILIPIQLSLSSLPFADFSSPYPSLYFPCLPQFSSVLSSSPPPHATPLFLNLNKVCPRCSLLLAKCSVYLTNNIQLTHSLSSAIPPLQGINTPAPVKQVPFLCLTPASPPLPPCYSEFIFR